MKASTLFKLDIKTGILTVKTANMLDIGSHSYILGVKLSDYSVAPYVPLENSFTVRVNGIVTLYPDFETNYTYTIGSLM
jgi:hypothetical protein